MKSSPNALADFSPEEIADLGEMDPNHPSAPWYLAYRRLRAKRLERRLISSAAKVPAEIRTNEVAIAAEPAAPVASVQHGDSVHRCTPDRYRPGTEDEAIALRLLRSVPLPLTTTRVARALVWPEHKARRWLAKFVAKGVLRARQGAGGGHSWVEARK